MSLLYDIGFLIGTDVSQINLCGEAAILFGRSDCGDRTLSQHTVIETVPYDQQPLQDDSLVLFRTETDNLDQYVIPLAPTIDIGKYGRWEITYHFCVDDLCPPETTQTVSHVIKIEYPCRDISLDLIGPFSSGNFVADYDEMIAEGTSYLLFQFINPVYGPQNDSFIATNGSCPDLIYNQSTYYQEYNLDPSTYEGTFPESIDFYLDEMDVCTLDFNPTFDDSEGDYYMKISVSYSDILGNDTEPLLIDELPLRFSIRNSCKPRKLSIQDDTNDPGAIHFNGVTKGQQGIDNIDWDAQTDLVIFGVNESYNCPVPYIGLELQQTFDYMRNIHMYAEFNEDTNIDGSTWDEIKLAAMSSGFTSTNEYMEASDADQELIDYLIQIQTEQGYDEQDEQDFDFQEENDIYEHIIYWNDEIQSIYNPAPDDFEPNFPVKLNGEVITFQPTSNDIVGFYVYALYYYWADGSAFPLESVVASNTASFFVNQPFVSAKFHGKKTVFIGLDSATSSICSIAQEMLGPNLTDCGNGSTLSSYAYASEVSPYYNENELFPGNIASFDSSTAGFTLIDTYESSNVGKWYVVITQLDPNSASPDCTDTSFGALDQDEDGCYIYDGLDCNGEWDDDDFTAEDMCCSCGGGEYIQEATVGSFILDVINQCAIFELETPAPFPTKIELGYNELISPNPQEYILDDYFRAIYNNGDHGNEFEEQMGACPSLTFFLEEITLPIGEIYTGGGSLWLNPDINEAEGVYTGKLVINYNIDDDYYHWDIPLTVVIENQCKPSSIYIDEFEPALPDERQLGKLRTQTLKQDQYSLTWNLDDELIAEGINLAGCPPPILGLDLISFNDADVPNFFTTAVQGGPGVYEANSSNAYMPVHLTGVQNELTTMTFMPRSDPIDQLGTYGYQFQYYWGGISELDAKVTSTYTYTFTVEPAYTLDPGPVSDGTPMTVLIGADSKTLNYCAMAVKQLGLTICDPGDGVEMFSYIESELFDAEFTELERVLTDADVGTWQVQLQYRCQDYVCTQSVNFELIVVNPCREVLPVFSSEPFLSGNFVADLQYSTTRLQYGFEEYAELDFGLYDAEFREQMGDCDFTLTLNFYEFVNWEYEAYDVGIEITEDITISEDITFLNVLPRQTTEFGTYYATLTFTGEFTYLDKELNFQVFDPCMRPMDYESLQAYVAMQDNEETYLDINFQTDIPFEEVLCNGCCFDPLPAYTCPVNIFYGLELSGIIEADCEDIDNGALDYYDGGCIDYYGNPSWCGVYDDSDFDSNAMCCACQNNVSFDNSEYGGTLNIAHIQADPNMPIEYDFSSKTIMFQPSTLDTIGDYYYNVYLYHDAAEDPVLLGTLQFTVEEFEVSIPDSEEVSIPNSEIWLQARTYFLETDFSSDLQINIDLDEDEYSFDLFTVVDYIDASYSDNTLLEFQIDLGDAEDFASYDSSSGELTVGIPESPGSFLIRAILSDQVDEEEWEMNIVAYEILYEIDTPADEGIPEDNEDYISVTEITDEVYDAFSDWFSDNYQGLTTQPLPSENDFQEWLDEQDEFELLVEADDLWKQYISISGNLDSPTLEDDQSDTDPADEQEEPPEVFDEETSEPPNEIDLIEEEEVIDYFEDIDFFCNDNFFDCSFFDDLEEISDSLDDNQIDDLLEQIEEVVITVELEGREIQLSMEDLSSKEGAIQDVFDQYDDEELDYEQQMHLFEEMLQYNLKYQEEKNRLRNLRDEIFLNIREQPKLAFNNFEPTGRFSLIFNENLVGLSFLDDLNRGLTSEGIVADYLENQFNGNNQFRQLESNSTASNFDLSNFLRFKLQKGGEDSADMESLRFNVSTSGILNDEMSFRMKFEQPEVVSIGSIKDKLIVEVINPAFFSSSQSGTTIEAGYTVSYDLPRILDEDYTEAFQLAGSSVEVGLQVGIVTQIVVTVFLAASLKSMWNLLNVVQVLSYMRFYSRWPALMSSVFLWMHNAVTLKPVSDTVVDFGKSKFEIANETLSDEGLRNSGISDPTLFKQLGIFAIVSLLLLIAVAIYFLLFICGKNVKLIVTVRTMLYKKLFFNGFLRYMIQSNLKLTYTIWGFFFGFYGLEFPITTNTLVSIGCLTAISFLLLYAFWSMVFLQKRQEQLVETFYQTHFSTLFDGIDIESKEALLYNSVFCLRRFLIVVINIFLNADCPWTNYDESRYFNKIILFLLVQSIYLLYVYDSYPHCGVLFNRLEVFNEASMVMLAYLMIAFSGIVQGQSSGNLLAEVLALLVASAIVISNFMVLLKKTITLMQLKAKKKKYMKKFKLDRLIKSVELDVKIRLAKATSEVGDDQMQIPKLEEEKEEKQLVVIHEMVDASAQEMEDESAGVEGEHSEDNSMNKQEKQANQNIPLPVLMRQDDQNWGENKQLKKSDTFIQKEQTILSALSKIDEATQQIIEAISSPRQNSLNGKSSDHLPGCAQSPEPSKRNQTRLQSPSEQSPYLLPTQGMQGQGVPQENNSHDEWHQVRLGRPGKSQAVEECTVSDSARSRSGAHTDRAELIEKN